MFVKAFLFDRSLLAGILGGAMGKERKTFLKERINAGEVAAALGVVAAGYALSVYLFNRCASSWLKVKVSGYSGKQALVESIDSVSIFILITALCCSSFWMLVWGCVASFLRERWIQIEGAFRILESCLPMRVLLAILLTLLLLLPLLLSYSDFQNKYILLSLYYIYFSIGLEVVFEGRLGRFVLHYFLFSLFLTLMFGRLVQEENKDKKITLAPTAYIHEGKHVNIVEKDKISLHGDQGVLVFRDGKYSLHGSYGEIVLEKVKNEQAQQGKTQEPVKDADSSSLITADDH